MLGCVQPFIDLFPLLFIWDHFSLMLPSPCPVPPCYQVVTTVVALSWSQLPPRSRPAPPPTPTTPPLLQLLVLVLLQAPELELVTTLVVRAQRRPITFSYQRHKVKCHNTTLRVYSRQQLQCQASMQFLVLLSTQISSIQWSPPILTFSKRMSSLPTEGVIIITTNEEEVVEEVATLTEILLLAPTPPNPPTLQIINPHTTLDQEASSNSLVMVVVLHNPMLRTMGAGITATAGKPLPNTQIQVRKNLVLVLDQVPVYMTPMSIIHR